MCKYQEPVPDDAHLFGELIMLLVQKTPKRIFFGVKM